MAAAAQEQVRRIITLPRRPDGRFKQPDWSAMSAEELADYAVGEQHRRDGAAHDADYADIPTGRTNTFDPTGTYLCLGPAPCNRSDGKRCLRVKVNDLKKFSSCNKWERWCAGDPETDNQALSQAAAGYVVGKQPFGCVNCPLQEAATLADSLGRDRWCTEWGCRVFLMACCAENDAPVEFSALPEDDDDNDAGTEPDGDADDAVAPVPGAAERAAEYVARARGKEA